MATRAATCSSYAPGVNAPAAAPEPDPVWAVTPGAPVWPAAYHHLAAAPTGRLIHIYREHVHASSVGVLDDEEEEEWAYAYGCWALRVLQGAYAAAIAAAPAVPEGAQTLTLRGAGDGAAVRRAAAFLNALGATAAMGWHAVAAAGSGSTPRGTAVPIDSRRRCASKGTMEGDLLAQSARCA